MTNYAAGNNPQQFRTRRRRNAFLIHNDGSKSLFDVLEEIENQINQNRYP